MNCPKCSSQAIVKNGSIHTGKQKYSCKDCGRQFVENPQNKNQPIPDETINIIEKLLLERLALAAIVRVTGVSKRWLQNYVNKKYSEISQEVIVAKKQKGKLTIECDEMWSFVPHLTLGEGQKKLLVHMLESVTAKPLKSYGLLYHLSILHLVLGDG